MFDHLFRLDIRLLSNQFPRLFSTTRTPSAFTTKTPTTTSTNSVTTTPLILFNCLPNNIHVAVSSPPGRLLFKLSSGNVGLQGAGKTAPKAIPLLLDALKARLTERGILSSDSGLLGTTTTTSTTSTNSNATASNGNNMSLLGTTGVRINFRGMSSARPLLVSGLRRAGLRILEVADSTGVPFNGCRPKKTRRL